MLVSLKIPTDLPFWGPWTSLWKIPGSKLTHPKRLFFWRCQFGNSYRPAFSKTLPPPRPWRIPGSVPGVDLIEARVDGCDPLKMWRVVREWSRHAQQLDPVGSGRGMIPYRSSWSDPDPRWQGAEDRLIVDTPLSLPSDDNQGPDRRQEVGLHSGARSAGPTSPLARLTPLHTPPPLKENSWNPYSTLLSPLPCFEGGIY